MCHPVTPLDCYASSIVCNHFLFRSLVPLFINLFSLSSVCVLHLLDLKGTDIAAVRLDGIIS